MGAARRKDFHLSRSHRDFGFSGCVDRDAIDTFIRRSYGNARSIDGNTGTGKTDLAFNEFGLISPGRRLHEAYLGVTSEPERIAGIELDICPRIQARCDAVIGQQRGIDESCDLLWRVAMANGNLPGYSLDVDLRIGGGKAQKQR